MSNLSSADVCRDDVPGGPPVTLKALSSDIMKRREGSGT